MTHKGILMVTRCCNEVLYIVYYCIQPQTIVTFTDESHGSIHEIREIYGPQKESTLQYPT